MIKAGSLVIVLMLVLGLALPVLAQDDPSPEQQAIDFLLTMQNEDGGFSNGYAPESDISTTADAVIAASAVGENPVTFLSGEMMNPLAFLGVQVQEGNVTGAGQAAKILTAVVAAGKDWEVFAGHNLVEDLLALQDEGAVFGFGAFDHCLSLIALQNADAELPAGSLDVLFGIQNEDGGWGFMAGEASDTNTTAMCLQALALVEQPDIVDAAFAYLATIQNEDGGWPYQSPSDFGTDSDTNSTALVTQALIAHDKDLAEWNNPEAWLLSMQNENGTFSYQAGIPGDILSTLAALPAVNGVALNAWAPVPAEAE